MSDLERAPGESPSTELQRELEQARAREQWLREEHRRLDTELWQSRRHLELLRHDLNALFNSLTWRAGNLLANVVRALTFNRGKLTVRNHIESIYAAHDEAQREALERLAAADDLEPAARWQRPQERAVMQVGPVATKPLRVGLFATRRGGMSLSGSAYIRLLNPLRANAIARVIETELIDTEIDRARGFDCIVVQRTALPNEQRAQSVLDHAQRLGIAVVLDLDDDLLAADRPGAEKQALELLLRRADLVTCSTPILGTRLRSYNERVEVLRNAIDPLLGREPDATQTVDENRPLRVLYMGTTTHAKDLAVLEPAWQTIKRRFGDRVELELVGVLGEHERGPGRRLTTDLKTGRDDYPAFIRWLQQNRSRWDIGVSPLTESTFNAAKSDIKVLDYTALGLPSIVSDVPAYSALESEVVKCSTTAQWVDALTALIESHERRTRLLRSANELLARRSLQSMSAHWLRALQRAMAHARADHTLRQVDIEPARYAAQHPDLAKRSDSALRSHWSTFGREEMLAGRRLYRQHHGRVEIDRRQMTADQREQWLTTIDQWQQPPLISVLVPVYKVDLRWLRACVESVRHQVYPHWQLILIDDASADTVIDRYFESLADEPRIVAQRLQQNVGIAAASNVALDLATGSHVALLDHDDELTPDALAQVAKLIVKGDPDFIYSDEAKLELDGTVSEPHLKPDFSRQQLLSQNYIAHLSIFRRDLLQNIGGFRQGFDGAQDHELLLRYLAVAKSVVHLPLVLYYWRKIAQSTAADFSAKDHAWEAGRQAVAAAVQRWHQDATAELGAFPGCYRARLPLAEDERATILVPFRDQAKLLDDCLTSIFDTVDRRRFDIVGVDNDSQASATHAAMSRWSGRGVRFIAHPGAFNFSAIVNHGVQQATAAHVLLLNNDVTAPQSGWLEALLEWSTLPDIGAVGGLLMYPDHTIQHAGVVLGIGGVAGHSHKFQPADHHGYFSRPQLIHSVSAVTGACLMVKRQLYQSIGGFDAHNLSIAFNDIDFCLRLIEAGYQNMYTPYCRLYHHESKSRGSEDTREKQARFAAEVRYMQARHCLALSAGDPYYHPGLTLTAEQFQAA